MENKDFLFQLSVTCMALIAAACIIGFVSLAFSRGFDDMGHSLEDQLAQKEAIFKTMQREAQRQRTWKAIYNDLQGRIAPRELVIPLRFKRNINLEFLEFLADNLSTLNTGDLIHFTNCWHGWGVEISRKMKWTKVCLKYDKFSNEYRIVDRKMMNEYLKRMESLR